MSEAAEYNVCISTKYKLMCFFRVINFLYFRIHIYCCVTTLIYKRNCVFAANSDFLIPITLQPVFLDLLYFKLLILVDQIV